MPATKHSSPSVSPELIRAMAGRVDRVSQTDWGAPSVNGTRGITICAGGPSYFVSAYLLLRLLRYHGCRLPIQLWHVGAEELDAKMRRLVRPYDVECVDANRYRQMHPVRNLAGWPLKPYAIIHSPFREVLALDADNYPVREPEYLFSYPEYQYKGAIFWPDLGGTEQERAIWEVMGIPFRNEPEFESGQIVVDKLKCWEPLRLAMWMNEKAAFFYRIIHGDKDTFRFAWHRYGRPFAMTRVPVQVLSVRGGPCCSGVMCQHDLDGFRIFQHRNIYKWRLHQHNPRIAGFLFEGECREFLAELQGLWNGRIGNSPTKAGRGHASSLMNQVWLVSGLPTISPAQNGPLNAAAPSGAVKTPAANAIRSEAPPNGVGRHEWIFRNNGRIQGSEESQLIYWNPGKGQREVEIGDGRRTHLILRRGEGSKWEGTWKSARGKSSVSLEPLMDVFPVLRGTSGNGTPHAKGVRTRTLRLFNSAKGIGDHVTAFYSCAGIANRGYEVIYHTRFPEWFARVTHPNLTINGNPPPTTDGAVKRWSDLARVGTVVDLNADYSVQVRHAPDNARWYSAAAISVTEGVIAPPSRPQWVNTAMESRPFDFSRYVLLFPFASWRGREWPLVHWTRLVHFLTEENFHVVAVGLEEDAARMHEAFNSTCAMWVTDQEPEWVMDAMLGASIVIGVDSGMVHVAGLLGVPAVCIHAHLPPEYLFSCAPSIRSIAPTTTCVFCRWRQEGGYTSACDAGCSALATVAPEDVASLALRLISKGGNGSRARERAVPTPTRAGN